MIYVGVSKRLISTHIPWKDPPPSFSVHKDKRDQVAVMKWGKGGVWSNGDASERGIAVAPGAQWSFCEAMDY